MTHGARDAAEATDQAGPADTGGDSDVAEYRRLVRHATAGIDEATVASWEEAGHLPATTVGDLARSGVFRERWRPGATAGLPWLVAMAEETSQICGGLALAAMGHSETFIGALQWLATTPRQQELLADALDGQAVGCFAATEPHGGSDLSALRASATGDDAGGWRLTGTKRYVSNLGTATHVLVLGRTAVRGSRDLALFLLPVDHPGVEVRGFFGTAGLRSCDVGEVAFDAHLPPDALLGSPGMGLAYASRLLQFERLSICAQLLATGRLATGLAAAFARRRRVGDGTLLDKQVVRHRLARASAELEVADASLRALVTDSVAGAPFAHRVAALKLVVSELVERVTDEAVQTLGARGYTTNFPLQRWWRDVRLARIGGGTDEALTEAVAGRLRRPDQWFDALLDRLAQEDEPLPDRRGRAG